MAIQTQTLTFNGAQSLDGDTPYIDLTGLSYTSGSSYGIDLGVTVADGNGVIVANVKNSTRTGTGFRVLVSDQFSGTVEVTTWDK